MFTCILGDRKLGKSIFVEDHIKQTDRNALYIATLPRLKMYEDTIREHQSRRLSSWDCVELFNMSAEEMLIFPYENYRNVILDNLSYYVLFQIYSNKSDFVRKCDERFISLIDKIAMEKNTMVYFIDTPFHSDIFKIENGITGKLFSRILEKAITIMKFMNKETISELTVEEGKKYLFNIGSW